MKTLWVKTLGIIVIACFVLYPADMAAGGWPADPTQNLPICTNLWRHQYPRIVSDGSDGAIITWQSDYEGTPTPHFDIYAQRVSAAGYVMWAVNGIPVTSAQDHQQQPRIVMDETGGAIIAWEDFRSEEEWDIYAQRVNYLGQCMWTADGVAICTAANDQSDLELVADGSGGAVILWCDKRVDSVTRDIYAQRVDTDGDVLWAADGIAVSAAPDDQGIPDLVAGVSNDVFVVWWDNRPPAPQPDIYAQRVSLNGTFMWALNGVPVCTASLTQTSPAVVVDGAGGIIVTWSDDRNNGSTNSDIYAQRVDSSGVTVWTTNGEPVCTFEERQGHPGILADGAGGAIICWPDFRNGPPDLYANRISPGGSQLWATDGIPICAAPYGSLEKQLTPDGNGGVIIAWQDSRDEPPLTYNIYAQRVDSTGNALWVANGVAVSTAVEDQRRVHIVPDGQGGAILAWEDWRDGGLEEYRYKIYAQRVGPDGTLNSPTGISKTIRPVSLQDLAIWPNPSSGATRLSLSLSERTTATMEVFNVAGKRVFIDKILDLRVGSNEYLFNGKDQTGRPLASGVYFFRITVGNDTAVRKFAITR